MWMEQTNPHYLKGCLLIFLLPGWVICTLEEWWASSGNSTLPGSQGICHYLFVEVVYKVRKNANEASFSDLEGKTRIKIFEAYF